MELSCRERWRVMTMINIPIQSVSNLLAISMSLCDLQLIWCWLVGGVVLAAEKIYTLINFVYII